MGKIHKLLNSSDLCQVQKKRAGYNSMENELTCSICVDFWAKAFECEGDAAD